MLHCSIFGYGCYGSKAWYIGKHQNRAGYIMEGQSPKYVAISFVLSHFHECSSFIPYDKMTNICLILYDMGFK